MASRGQRRPALSAGLSSAELEFFTELRRLIDLAGLTCRALERSTLSAKSASVDACFYSKSQWARWLNAHGLPPRKAVRHLVEALARQDVDAGHLTQMWERAFVPDPGHGNAAVPDQPATSPGVLIGRDRELAMLTGLVTGVAAGRGSAVLIEGEPGIGKSVLVRVALAPAASSGCQVFWGAGDELGQALPLQPWLDGLRLREPSADPRRNTIIRLLRGEVAADHCADWSAMLAEQLLALVGEQCAMRPTVLVVDDLQWADEASLMVWSRLARSVRKMPLLLVGMLRPVPRREAMLPLRRAVDATALLQLTGLTDVAVTELMASLVGGTPDGEILRLADDAAGNPLYITELAAALTRNSQVTVTGTGIATLTAESAPSSLSAAIADRLGFVSRPVREVLGMAALLGGEFAVTDLAIIVDRNLADLVRALDEACAAGVLAESGQRLRFRHPLIRATLYEQMPVPVRVAWHRHAGRALAAAGAAADQVARQLLQALPGGAPGPMDEWMLSWLAGAAELLVSQAPRVAADLLRQAAASSLAGSQRDLLAARLADALYRVGDIAGAEQAANQALVHAVEPDIVVDLHWTLAQCRMQAGLFAECRAAVDRALASPGISARHRARLLVLAARTHVNSDELETADRVATIALEAAAEAGDSWAMGWALLVLAGASVMWGHLTDALSLHERALAVTHSDPALTDLRLLLQINMAVTLGALDRYEEALTIARQARDVADEVGATLRLAQAHGALSQLFFHGGHWEDALTELESVPEDLKEPAGACCDFGIAALIMFHRGEIAAARRHLSAAQLWASRLGHRLISPLALARSLDRELDGALPAALDALTCAFGDNPDDVTEAEDLFADAVRLAARIGDLHTAQAVAAHAVALATGSDIPRRQANALYCRGLLDRDARGLLSAAGHYSDAGRPLLQAKALEAAAEELVRVGHRDRAQAAFTRATEIYSGLGAAMDAARLATARSAPRA